MRGRSFRQFEPSRDASPGKGIILDFFGPISIWAQYADRAVSEWETASDDYRIERRGGSSEITIYLDQPRSIADAAHQVRRLHIDRRRIHIRRDVFDSAKISFKVNNPHGVLPSLFPVFGSWTRFSEDEYME